MLPDAAFNHPDQLQRLLAALQDNGFAVVDAVYSKEFVQALRSECLQHLPQFRDAAIQNGVVSSIRSDQILWFDDAQVLASQHVACLQHFSTALNQAFYLGVQTVEAHFACYDAGRFYALHRDNPQQKNGRQISTVYYLHETWPASAGGELRLQDCHNVWHIVPPKPNRMVIFQSDLLHEVLPAQQQRLSITAWLRSTENPWI